ncbi:hypothetical protein DNTS_014324 [Danionella cerebrum]|uniref:TRIM8/14/16/25/29/45/65 coiled-coil region domain-containing protein n=1 Tax=Danionella cerebrum TaxID=2873325 RepID=A0A553QQE6_9TELE|nr:hypothetical protein DNTS_014324 [Danionella translucida]
MAESRISEINPRKRHTVIEVTGDHLDGEEASVSRAQERMKRLEQEIHDLRRRNTELEKLSLADHHLHFLQSFQSLSDDAPGSSGSSSGALASPLTFDRVHEFVPHWRKEMDLISARASFLTQKNWIQVEDDRYVEFVLISHHIFMELRTLSCSPRSSQEPHEEQTA